MQSRASFFETLESYVVKRQPRSNRISAVLFCSSFRVCFGFLAMLSWFMVSLEWPLKLPLELVSSERSDFKIILLLLLFVLLSLPMMRLVLTVDIKLFFSLYSAVGLSLNFSRIAKARRKNSSALRGL